MPMSPADASARILDHLRQHGTTQNADLLALLGGDAALYASVRQHLVDTGQALDVGGIGLKPAAAPPPPPPAEDKEPDEAQKKPWDLFVSYAHADDHNGFVSRLVERFKQAELAYEIAHNRPLACTTVRAGTSSDRRARERHMHRSFQPVVSSPRGWFRNGSEADASNCVLLRNQPLKRKPQNRVFGRFWGFLVACPEGFEPPTC